MKLSNIIDLSLPKMKESARPDPELLRLVEEFTAVIEMYFEKGQSATDIVRVGKPLHSPRNSRKNALFVKYSEIRQFHDEQNKIDANIIHITRENEGTKGPRTRAYIEIGEQQITFNRHPVLKGQCAPDIHFIFDAKGNGQCGPDYYDHIINGKLTDNDELSAEDQKKCFMERLKSLTVKLKSAMQQKLNGTGIPDAVTPK